jgi:galactose-1-phosphate uridylyltransferase
VAARQQLDRRTLERILQVQDIETTSFSTLVKLFREEERILGFLPDGVHQIDPRNGDRILYNSSRARRPHDNQAPTTSGGGAVGCVICQGNTTGIVDAVPLSEGFTFINKNLFPVLYPLAGEDGAARGMHFLQWTSSLHDRDWHNMDPEDLSTVMARLAALERVLLTDPEGEGVRFVSIIKNYGRKVGGSLEHGHQQIVVGNVMPRCVADLRRFEEVRGETFAAYLLRENPADLIISDYGATVLLIPYFMRRPYDMMLLVKDTGKRHLYELSRSELGAVARGWHDATRAIHSLLPAVGREIAYNVLTHNGPGAGLHFEFLPFTQEDGGLEKLGLYVCQQNPAEAAGGIRQALGET